ncbi:zinc-binding dehydrogenase [candidate division GN15 bacterium]|nr:zinc-binding dehydrogenase [candidate division GN15 bacterium]
MKAITRSTYGSPDVLTLSELDKPDPNDNQALVRIRAASVNPLDWHVLRGTPRFIRMQTGLTGPKSPKLGVDMAGEVEAVGKDVTEFKPGDAVYGEVWGAFAEYVAVSETMLAPKPSNLTFEQTAAIPVAGYTALQALRDKGQVTPGQRVLINGASGGVGTFAVQIAKAMGAEVAGVCSTRNVELVSSLGADRVFDYTREDFTLEKDPYDVIFDNIGNRTMAEYRRIMTPGGVFIMVGADGNKGGYLNAMFKVMVLSKFFSQSFTTMMAKANKQDLLAINRMIEAGQVTPVIDRQYPLDQVPDAIRYLEEGHARGKVVVTV